jgi:hypothetical protein
MPLTEVLKLTAADDSGKDAFLVASEMESWG